MTRAQIVERLARGLYEREKVRDRTSHEKQAEWEDLNYGRKATRLHYADELFEILFGGFGFSWEMVDGLRACREALAAGAKDGQAAKAAEDGDAGKDPKDGGGAKAGEDGEAGKDPKDGEDREDGSAAESREHAGDGAREAALAEAARAIEIIEALLPPRVSHGPPTSPPSRP